LQASRILEMGPPGAEFDTPVLIEVPHFASLRDGERELVVLRSFSPFLWDLILMSLMYYNKTMFLGLNQVYY
jgi:hypothetical protein